MGVRAGTAFSGSCGGSCPDGGLGYGPDYHPEGTQATRPARNRTFEAPGARDTEPHRGLRRVRRTRSRRTAQPIAVMPRVFDTNVLVYSVSWNPHVSRKRDQSISPLEILPVEFSRCPRALDASIVTRRAGESCADWWFHRPGFSIREKRGWTRRLFRQGRRTRGGCRGSFPVRSHESDRE